MTHIFTPKGRLHGSPFWKDDPQTIDAVDDDTYARNVLRLRWRMGHISQCYQEAHPDGENIYASVTELIETHIATLGYEVIYRANADDPEQIVTGLRRPEQPDATIWAS